MAEIPRYRRISAQCFIARSDGTTWVDVTSAFSGIDISCGDVGGIGGGSGVDSVVQQATLTFRSSRRESGIKRSSSAVVGDAALVISDSAESAADYYELIFDAPLPTYVSDSLSPRDWTASRNLVGGAYAPLIYPYREVLVKTAITEVGIEAQAGDYRTIFHGLLGDSIKDDGSGRVVCQCRDMAKRLQDCYIEVIRAYGSEEGTPAETVMQAIMDDNLGASAPALYVPVASEFLVRPYQVEYGSVWDAIQAIASQMGWYLGYRYDSTADDFLLTLLEPPRAKTVPDYDLVYTQDFFREDLDINDRSVRNSVSVTYRDATTGQRTTVYAEDPESIASYGRRAMAIEEADTSLIDTAAEAENFASAALWDLKDLYGAVLLDMPYFPDLQLFDLCFVTNPRISSYVDYVAVTSLSHTIRLADGMGGESQFRTEVSGGMKVIGGFMRWLAMQTRPGATRPTTGADITSRVTMPAPTWNRNPLVSGDMGADPAGPAGTTYAQLAWAKPAGEYYPAQYRLKHKPSSASIWSESLVSGNSVRLHGLTAGTTYQAIVSGISAEGVEGTASQTLAWTTPTVTGSVGTANIANGAISAGTSIQVNDNSPFSFTSTSYVSITGFSVSFTLEVEALVLVLASLYGSERHDEANGAISAGLQFALYIDNIAVQGRGFRNLVWASPPKIYVAEGSVAFNHQAQMAAGSHTIEVKVRRMGTAGGEGTAQSRALGVLILKK